MNKSMSLDEITIKFSMAFTMMMLATLISSMITVSTYDTSLFNFFYTRIRDLEFVNNSISTLIRALLMTINDLLSWPLMFLPNEENMRLFSAFFRAPIVEEIEFRGFLFVFSSKLSDRNYYFLAIFSSILFVIVHPTNILNMFDIFTFGMLSSWLIRETRQIWPSMLMHSTYNMFMCFLSKTVIIDHITGN